MREELEGYLEAANDFVKEKPLHIASAIVLVAALAVFWNYLFLVLRGLLYAALALIAIFAGILVWAKLRYRQPSLKELFKEKKRLLRALKIAEKKYMRRKLSEKDFNALFKEKQRLLIQVEAEIEQHYNKEKGEKATAELLKVQAKKRHFLRGLLDEKRRIIKELDLAEKSYLKRAIDAKTYQELVQKNQHRLIDLEAEIKELYAEANVSEVMTNLKQKLSSLEKRKKDRKSKKELGDKKRKMQIAKEIAEQVSKK